MQINASKQSKHAESNGFGEICIRLTVQENRSNQYGLPITGKAHIIEVLDFMKKRMMSINSAYLTTPKWEISIESLKLWIFVEMYNFHH